MRWAAVGIAIGATGCWDTRSDAVAEAIVFQSPERVLVAEGDTAESLAAQHGVTAAEIRDWNDGIAIEPGVVLLIWKSRTPSLADMPLDGEPVANLPRPRRAPPGGSRGAPSAAPPRPAPGMPLDRPRSVRSAGIFAADLEDVGNDGLADAVAGLEAGRGQYGQTGLRAQGDMRASQVDASEDLSARVARNTAGPSVPDAPVTVPRLSMPAAKRCKVQGAGSTGEDGMYGGEGLSSAAVKSGVSTTLNTTRRCFPSGSSGRFSIIVELLVGCDGRVKNTFTINGGGLPTRVTDCIEKVLGHSSFAAHDLPDGQSFQYPINYSF